MSRREEFLTRYLEEYLSRKGVKLSEEEYALLRREFLRFACDPTAGGVRAVPTADGSLTLMHSTYMEPFHSQTAGAVREALEKFLKPSRLLEKARKKERLRILEVGFGIGVNVAVALTHILDLEMAPYVEVISLEKELLENVPLLPDPYRRIHEEILRNLPYYETERFSVRVVLGDARKKIREVTDFKADAVFHDAFSPYKNPELWTYDFLKLIKERMEEEGYWVSYSSSLSVRKSLQLLGFKVGSSGSVGRRRRGTVASPGAPVPPLTEEEVRKLAFSPFAVPMRDPTLGKEPLEILIDYLLEVYKLVRKL